MSTGQERRRFLIGAGLVGGGVALAGGVYALNQLNKQLQQIENLEATVAGLKIDQPSETVARRTSTPNSASTPTQPVTKISTQTAISTETPTQQISQTPSPDTLTPTPEISQSEVDNWKMIQTAQRGDVKTLNQPNLAYIVSIAGGYYGIIEVYHPGGTKHIFIENVDCQFREATENNLLGEPKQAGIQNTTTDIPAWQVIGKPFESMQVEFNTGYTVGVPVLLESQSFVFTTDNATQKISCPKEKSIFDPIKQAGKEVIVPLLEKAYQWLKDKAN